MDSASHFLILKNPDTDENIRLSYHNLKKSLHLMRALNHTLRQQLLKLLNEHKKLTVTEIYDTLRMDQSVVSQHLAILRRARLVTAKKESRFVYYMVNYKRLKEINDFIEQLLPE